MSSKTLTVVIVLLCALTFISTQSSCRGRCSAEYYRGNMCQCDHTCLSYDECCRDYESQCTTENSCKGRCGETFKRGRLCSCDSDCSQFKQCCPDYNDICDMDVTTAGISGAATGPSKSNSCDNVHDNNPKESTLKDDSSFGEGNNADDNLFTPGSSTKDLSTDSSDVDIIGEIFPNDDFSTNGLDDPEASLSPEVSSGDELTSSDPLDKIPTEATMTRDDFNTEKTLPFTESTPVDDISAPMTTSGTIIVQEDLAIKPDKTTSRTTGDYDLLDRSTLAPEIEPTVPSRATETEKDNSPTDEPEVTTNMQDLNLDLGNSQLNTSPASTTSASFIPPEETTSMPNIENGQANITTVSPDVLPNIKDPVSTLSTAGEWFASSTATTPDITTVGVKPEVIDASTSKPETKPDMSELSTTSKPDIKPLDPPNQITHNSRDYQGDDSSDTNLCSGRPIGGITTLRNGTIVVFRGHYFWFLDRNLVPSPPKGITEVWGVPSPIDTVFTRCNCQGKTYIFKGGKYWRFENDALDPGYPKGVKTGFNGLQGHITAALSVPQYLSRKESVYFFKRGGTVQKYSYQFGTSSTCGRAAQPPVYTVRARLVRQAVSVLEPAINIRRSWRGFPHTVTAAVSVPSNRDPEGYKYIVFSRSTAFNVKMRDDGPVIAPPRENVSPKTNNFFRCPQKS